VIPAGELYATMRPRPWDEGIRWQTEGDAAVTSPPWQAVSVKFVTEKILRALTGGYEDDLIAGYIETATDVCEAYTDQSVRPQRRRQVMSGFPAGRVELQRGPVRAMVAVTYYDPANVEQLLPESAYVLIGGKRPTLEPAVGTTWPATATRGDAVAIKFDAGYEVPEDVPAMIRTGIGAFVGELYKNPDLSNADAQVANTLNLDYFWKRHW
jgi:uncharacterized phiE125 gp8 family phage protein